MSTRLRGALLDVEFRHAAALEPLFAGLTLELVPGFCGVIGPNGSGKTTLLQLVTGLLRAESGSVQIPQPTVYCPQRTDTAPAGLQSFLSALDAQACSLRGILQIDRDFAQRWDTLSEGQRKRAQIAVALWGDPALLAIDEPTNHIDADARAALLRALQEYRGIGLLVSHDRELLDTLCSQCLWLEPPGAALYPGGYSQARALIEHERAERVRRADLASAELQRIEAERGRRRDAANRSDARRSKRGLAPHDHDGRARINLARVSGKDGQAGRVLRQLDGRARRAQSAVSELQLRKEAPRGIQFGASESRRAILLDVPGASLPLGPQRQLRFPALCVRRGERIALSGANGLGKSTLLRFLLASAAPAVRIAALAQEMLQSEGMRLLDAVRALDPGARGRVMNAVSRLGSQPERLLASRVPSPGEARKLRIALELERAPELLVLDEPTNHLDLPSIESLEAALEEFPGALLLVTHDTRCQQRLANRRWHIEPTRDPDGAALSVLE